MPATGAPPLRFTAQGLPAVLAIDAATGIISGKIGESGESVVQLTVRGPRGSARRDLRIVAGKDALALTPPMGWNSWNVWGPAVDAQKVLEAAEWLERSGLAAHGFQYIVIDDAWMGKRTPTGELVPNEKFPDMRALADAVHARGLKLGIYSSPGPKTCEEFAGSWQHEAQDAATFAAWGVDFLKYDWCSYEEIAPDHSLAELQKPYQVMRDALSRVDRDIVYALCQYGYGDVWKWGAEVGEYGGGGHPYLETPHIDAPALAGTTFRNAYHTTPLRCARRIAPASSPASTHHATASSTIPRAPTQATACAPSRANCSAQVTRPRTLASGTWAMIRRRAPATTIG